MKNYLFLGMISTAVFFNSCSSNDENQPTEKKLLLSKVTTNYFYKDTKTQIYIDKYEYNAQGELIKISNNNGFTTIEYDKDKPIKLNYHFDDQHKENYYSEVYYNGNQINKIEQHYPFITDKYITLKYTYNTNGQIASSSGCWSPDCSESNTTFYTYSGNNISVKKLSSTKFEYFYDNKLSPYTYMNKYIKIWLERFGLDHINNNNNYIARKSTISGEVSDFVNTLTYTYEYNSSGLPVKGTGKDSDQFTFVQYNYEYITL
ncbi:hypothetical protein [Chryseobacterium sp. BIGb0232]|uniref:hypothetical protein n=1 Tax=Chryseobacterium sp. BIGb0232 TaxID=2940598 RepID=UPI000F478EB7|nr:hypothetical protein [Chryseobacterium sp. BIGb0232]MCS4301292.1 major membrane immunogen (membrane-anchored lipoprotein) [Chryseobacterium sp. BIGb0232]ROS19848.1 YD repeat-containing protein [Chryseobacterium nakagawai]